MWLLFSLVLYKKKFRVHFHSQWWNLYLVFFNNNLGFKLLQEGEFNSKMYAERGGGMEESSPAVDFKVLLLVSIGYKNLHIKIKTSNEVLPCLIWILSVFCYIKLLTISWLGSFAASLIFCQPMDLDSTILWLYMLLKIT